MARYTARAATVICLVLLGAIAAVAVGGGAGVSDREIGAFGAVGAAPETQGGGPDGPIPTGAPVVRRPVSADGAPAADPATLPSRIPVPETPVVLVRSGSLSALQAPPPPAPVAISIGSIALSAPVERVGYDQRRDEMEVPRSREIVGWYEHGPSPGQPGSAVLAAHVDWNGKEGAFYDLSDVVPGTMITVSFDDGSQRRFRAEALAQFSKPDLPVDRLFAKDGPAVLTLITCGGSFDRSAGSYRDNVVLQAVEIPAATPVRRS